MHEAFFSPACHDADAAVAPSRFLGHGLRLQKLKLFSTERNAAIGDYFNPGRRLPVNSLMHSGTWRGTASVLFMLVEVTFFQASLRASVPLQSALRSLHGPGFRCRAPQSKEKLHASTSCSWSTVASHHQWQLLIHLAAVVPNPEPVLKSRRFRQSLRTTAFFQLSCLRVDEAVARPLLRLLPSSPALVLAI